MTRMSRKPLVAIAAGAVVASSFYALPVAAADYPPKLPTQCAITALTNQRVRVTITPLDNPAGYRFQLQRRRDNGTWRTLPDVYRTRPPSQTRVVSVRPGVYRAQCQGGSGYLNSTSRRVTVRTTPKPIINQPKRKPKTFVPGQTETLVKSAKLPKEDRDKYQKARYRVLCKPIKKKKKTSIAGEVSYCTYRVTKRGGLKVRVFGNQKVRVTAIVTVRPKPKYRKEYGVVTYRETWILRPAR